MCIRDSCVSSSGPLTRSWAHDLWSLGVSQSAKHAVQWQPTSVSAIDQRFTKCLMLTVGWLVELTHTWNSRTLWNRESGNLHKQTYNLVLPLSTFTVLSEYSCIPRYCPMHYTLLSPSITMDKRAYERCYFLHPPRGIVMLCWHYNGLKKVSFRRICTRPICCRMPLSHNRMQIS